MTDPDLATRVAALEREQAAVRACLEAIMTAIVRLERGTPALVPVEQQVQTDVDVGISCLTGRNWQ